MITSGTYASTRTLIEDSTGFFDYMQKGDTVTSTTYGNITMAGFSSPIALGVFPYDGCSSSNPLVAKLFPSDDPGEN